MPVPFENAFEEIVERVNYKREQLAETMQALKEDIRDFKLIKTVKNIYNAVLTGMDVFILTPVRCLQAATRSGQGITALLFHPGILLITFGLSGIFAFILVLAEFYKLWRDHKRNSIDFICRKLIESDINKESEAKFAIRNYLAKHEVELSEITTELFPNYELAYIGNSSIDYLHLEKVKPRVSEPEQKEADMPDSSSSPLLSAPTPQVKVEAKQQGEQEKDTWLDKLAVIGAYIRHSRIGRFAWPVWKALLLYSYGYWIVFALALFSGQFAVAGVAFSLGYAFIVPAIIPAVYLLVRACRSLWRAWYGNKTDPEAEREAEAITDKMALKQVKVKILKAFVLRKLGKDEVEDFDNEVDELLSIKAAKDEHTLEEAAKKMRLIQEKRQAIYVGLKQEKNQSEVFMVTFANGDQISVAQKKQELMAKLKGNETTRKWLGGVFSFANGYMFGFFAMWPLLDIACLLYYGITQLILPAPIMWALFAFYLAIGTIYALHGVYKARAAYRTHVDKVDANADKLEEIAFLKLALRFREEKYLALRQRFLTEKGKKLPDLYLPDHEDGECIKWTNHRHHSMSRLERVGDFIKYALQQGGTGAFLIRSFITLGPILLFIGPDPVAFFGSVALGLCIAIAATVWIAVKFYEYHKNEQYAHSDDFINNLDLRKDMLIQEIVILETETEDLQRKFDAPPPAPIAAINTTLQSRFSCFNLFEGWRRANQPGDNGQQPNLTAPTNNQPNVVTTV